MTAKKTLPFPICCFAAQEPEPERLAEFLAKLQEGDVLRLSFRDSPTFTKSAFHLTLSRTMFVFAQRNAPYLLRRAMLKGESGKLPKKGIRIVPNFYAWDSVVFAHAFTRSLKEVEIERLKNTTAAN